VLKSEVQILGKLDHPNIIKLYEFYDEKDNFVLITEVIEGGELLGILGKNNKLTEKRAANLIE
jgi:calcium-dependent protein kinase